jgi:hypothetical protein
MSWNDMTGWNKWRAQFPILVLISCNISLSFFIVGIGVYIQNILITSYLWQRVEHADVHEDLRQLSYGLVKVRSYGRYDINEFWFESTQFEALRPLLATTNTGVVTRAIDDQGCHTPFRDSGNEASIRVPRMFKSHV